MARGTWTWPALAMVAAGCAADRSELTIRAARDPLTAATQPSHSLVAEARALLALGNAGLAIEAFRKVLRQQPDNVEALTGLAECYARMGRHDLSRAKLEAALAIAPNDPTLLRQFAALGDRRGRLAQAVATPAVEGNSPDRHALAAPSLENKPAIVESTPAKVAAATSAPAADSLPAVVRTSQPSHPSPVAEPAQPRTGSITVKLPAVQPPKRREAATVAEEPGETQRVGRGPRLERLSLAEVALVTTPQPRWRPEIVRRTASSTTIRFVPLAQLQPVPPIRLLNAARHEGLAARTRVALNRKGWGRVTIGNAGKVRSRSLVLYSQANRIAAQRLAAQFGFGIAKDPRPGPVTVLLGRDAAAHAAKMS